MEIGFEQGVPVKLDGKATDSVKLLETLNEIGGKHAVGQIDLVENRLVGMKSRGAYETPGGTILMTAHKSLETLTLDRETMHYKQQVSLEIRGDGLLRPVVLSVARGARCVHRRYSAKRYRLGAGETFQGPLHAGGREKPVQLIQRRICQFQNGRGI